MLTLFLGIACISRRSDSTATLPCGKGTHADNGQCVADGADTGSADADTDTDSDSDTDADTDTDTDTSVTDADDDGYTGAEDCDEGNAAINIAATEVCDGIDNNCDGTADNDDAVDALTWYADTDGDGYGAPDASTTACDAPTGYVADYTDCDDTNDALPDALGNCAVRYTTAYGSDMLVINPGTFTMAGGNGDSSATYTDHEVELTHTFWLGEHEVTQDEWAAWTAAPDTTPSYFSGGDRPVEQVGWETVAWYANALSAEEGLTPCYESDGSDVAAAYLSDPYSCPGYRLPTEAEWEYAARAGEDTTYAGSDTIEDVAWYSTNSRSITRDVCGLAVNAWDLCDMSGNVYEWTNDWYSSSYGGYGSGAASTDPAGPSSGSYRVLRGGSWRYDASYARVADRYMSAPPSSSTTNIGFRLSRSSLVP